MQLMVEWCMGLAILFFIVCECVVLYMARTKQHGILLESATAKLPPHETPAFVRLLDRLLTAVIVSVLLLYLLYMYMKLSQSTAFHELQATDIGMLVLLYILFPSRKITHVMTDTGLQQRQSVTAWESIYAVSVSSEPAAKRMLFVQLRSRGKVVEGYMYERDLNGLKKLLAPHPILFKEIVYDRSWRD